MSGKQNDPLILTATLLATTTNAPLSNRTLTFVLGRQTATATTNASGIASVTITPSGVAGNTLLTVTYAGEVGYLGSSTTATVAIAGETAWEIAEYVAMKLGADGMGLTYEDTMADLAESALHPIDSLHGDLGIVGRNDVAIVLSKSGESQDLFGLLGSLQRMNVPVIAITGGRGSVAERAVESAW